uniref:hypothetical protein n=1 Tax=Candidatus Hecatella orcuttiae TaxID=1935119 RepID=UPI002867FA7F
MAKEWDVSEISCSVGGVEIDDLLSFSYDNEDEITHIETVNGVVGYNKKFAKPTWTLKCRATSEALNQLVQFKENKEEITVTFKAPGLVVNCYDAIIKKIDPGEVGGEATEVSIDG